jgi:hypothetical protein
LREVARALCSTGGFLIQIPNCFGIRCLYHQVRRGFREGRDFDMRYWTPAELGSTFRTIFGSARIFADVFFRSTHKSAMYTFFHGNIAQWFTLRRHCARLAEYCLP